MEIPWFLPGVLYITGSVFLILGTVVGMMLH